jgi:hypothetical protein
MYLQGSAYAADGVPYTVGQTVPISITYIYHNLFLTLLKPGDTLTEVSIKFIAGTPISKKSVPSLMVGSD